MRETNGEISPYEGLISGGEEYARGGGWPSHNTKTQLVVWDSWDPLMEGIVILRGTHKKSQTTNPNHQFTIT